MQILDVRNLLDALVDLVGRRVYHSQKSADWELGLARYISILEEPVLKGQEVLDHVMGRAEMGEISPEALFYLTADARNAVVEIV